MDPITIILGLASAAGAIMRSSDGRPIIDPNFLKQHFGAQAVTDEFVKQFNLLLNSDYGRNALASAATQGSRIATDVAANAARAGFGPGEGQDAGSAIFGRSVAESAGDSLARSVRAELAAQSLKAAQDRVSGWQQAYLQSYLNKQGTPTQTQSLGQAIGDAAGIGLLTPKAAVPSTPISAPIRPIVTEPPLPDASPADIPNLTPTPRTATLSSVLQPTYVTPYRNRTRLWGGD